jgi:uncharacterized protein involved in response to NO
MGLAAANGYGARLGVATAIRLIALIGGRLVPSFSRNRLARRAPGRHRPLSAGSTRWPWAAPAWRSSAGSSGPTHW